MDFVFYNGRLEEIKSKEVVKSVAKREKFQAG